MSDWGEIAEQIGAATGEPFVVETSSQVSGGCINTAVRLSDGQRSFFVKRNDAVCLDMFEAEAEGLREIADSSSIRAPRPICTGIAGHHAHLVMEYISFGRAGPDSARQVGRRLAALHRQRSDRFGWHRDNTIGSTPQPNRQRSDWVAFWCDQRLGFQLRLAAAKGYAGQLQQQGERLLEDCPALIDHGPEPSLLHGDLWGGNLAYDDKGGPVIYDPAVYYGDRETDLAMTELFGGFGADFYAAYDDAWPRDAGYSVRKTLYNLYHILNHLNLFGSGYLGQARGMIDQLLSELR